MKHIILTVITILLIFTGSAQNTNSTSRQFEKTINILALSNDLQEVSLNLLFFYQFNSTDQNAFDEKGFFMAENKTIESLPSSQIRSVVREVISKHTSEELQQFEKQNLEEKISKTLIGFSEESKAIDGFIVKFNHIILQEMEHAYIINRAKDSDLLGAYNDLKSNDSMIRMKSIEKLLENGSETSYLIILDHWSREKDQKIQNYILKYLVNKK